ncbi:unnamed protein product, partial [Rotaria sp. Silwood2]
KVCRSRQTSAHSKVNTIFSVSHIPTTDEHPIQIQIQIDGVQVNFELDTGSPITVINESVWKSIGKPELNPIKLTYNSFSGHPIYFRSEALVNVNYNGQNTRLHLLVGGTNRNNIIGRNWIHALHINTQTLDDIVLKNKILHVNSELDNLDQLLNHYQEIFKKGLGRCKIKAQLHIKPNVTPKICKPRSLSFAYRQAVENNLNRLVSEQVLEPINTAKWAAPIVVVPKPADNVRICADFSTGVNAALDIDKYPLPKPTDIFVALNGGTLFSKIDLSEAYMQVELEDNTSAPSIFQQIMDQMIAGLDGTICYLDDIIVTGKNKIDHLNKLFIRIKDFGFTINKSKCVFLQNHVEYLDFIVDKNGIHSSPSKIKAIIDMPKPTNLSQLRSFLCMINHYSKSIPKLSDRLSVFYSLLKKDTIWNWNETCDQTFTSLKKLFTSPLALTQFDPTIPLVLGADTSNSGVGAVIYHRYPDGSEKVIAHASKTVTLTENHYSQIEKKALAIIYGVEKFDQFLRGRKFTLLTDHRPLTFIFASKEKGINTNAVNRVQRWAIRLMGYTYDIEYCSTDKFGQADGLSRLPIGSDIKFDKQDTGEISLLAIIQNEYQNNLPLRASQIAQATGKDSLLKLVYDYILSGWPSKHPELVQPYFRIRNEFSTSNGCITWGLRTIIPSCFKNRLLKHLHLTHSGMSRMKAEVRRYFWWPSLDKDIEDLARKCQACSQNSKQPAKVPLQQWHGPEKPWQRIHIDFMGKFMGLYFLIIVDAHSKWLEVIMMNSITTAATIDALSSLFARYETTPHATTNTSPAELFLKRQLRTVLDLLRSNANDLSNAARQRYRMNFDRHTKERYFNSGDEVLVRDFRFHPNKINWTPGVLIQRQGSCIWAIKVGDKIWRRHENQIKHRYWSSDEDFITINSPTSNTTTDLEKSLTSSTSLSDLDPQTLRRSSRFKKPTHRLIEEI